MAQLATLLTVLFIGLKLCDVIAWSWFLVFSPLIGLAVLELLIIVGAALLVVLSAGKRW